MVRDAQRAPAAFVTAWWGAIALGAGLRLWQYLGHASQWVDELGLSRSIVELPLARLLCGPLLFGQVAAPGFLLVERAATALAGANDFALRLLPLAASLIALVLVLRLAVRLRLTPAAIAAALALCALQPELIRYAAQVKPYAVDVAVALALTLVAAGMVDAEARADAEAGADAEAAPASLRRAAWGGAAGVAAVPVSHAAVLTLAGLALGLVLSAWLRSGFGIRLRRELVLGAPRRGRSVADWAPLAVTIGLWGLAAGGALLMANRAMTPQMAAYFHHFWAPSFAPWPPRLAADARWAVAAIGGQIGAAGLEYPWPPVYAALALLGFVLLWRRSRELCILLFGPPAVVLGAAGAGLYPFASRLVLFIVPALILAIAAGAEAVVGLIRRLLLPPGQAPTDRSSAAVGGAVGGAGGVGAVGGVARPPAAAAAVLAPVLAALVYAVVLAPAALAFAADPPVYRYEEMRPILAAVAAHRRPGDAFYVYYGAGQAVRFYGPEFGLDPDSYVLGGCHRGDTRAYLHEVDRFRGQPRLWVLVAHAHPYLGEQAALLAYLDHLGSGHLEVRTDPHGSNFGLPAYAYLYDLRPAWRSPGNDADTFPLPPPARRPNAAFACFGTANPVSEPEPPPAAAGSPASRP